MTMDEVVKEQEEVLENQEIQQEKVENEEAKAEIKEEKAFEPHFTIREMLEAGVHFGHRTARWNAKMAPYIYGVKNELHIIDLTQSAILLAEASKILREIVKRHGRILFVCTKKQGAETVKEVAVNCGQYYVTNKWLGGMLTNWKTISRSIKTLKEIEAELADEKSTLTKKEKLMLSRRKEKLDKQLGGIRDMSRLPDLVFVVDTPREALSIAVAKSLGIQVMAIVDTNSDPDNIDYPIPGNDDSIKAIKLYMRVIEEALKDALENAPIIKKDFTKKENKKVQSKKPSKALNKAKHGDKLPVAKKEAKAHVVKKENKAPAIKEEAKTPATTEEKVEK